MRRSLDAQKSHSNDQTEAEHTEAAMFQLSEQTGTGQRCNGVSGFGKNKPEFGLIA